MKKILFSLAALVACYSFGQSYDLEALLLNPAEGAFVMPSGEQQVGFNCKNNGPDTLMQGDTLWLGISIGGTYYAMNGTANSASGLVLQQNLYPGTSFIQPFGIQLDLGNVDSTTQVCVHFYGFGAAAVQNPATGDANDPNYANNSACFTVEPNLGIEENQVKVSAFPNPASDVLRVEINGEIDEITILSVTGELIRTVVGSLVDVADLKAGTYFYRIRTADGKTGTGQFIKS